MFKHRPSDRWAYAAVLVFTALGFSLMAFGPTPEAVAGGLLLVSVVAAALAASLGAPRIPGSVDRRLALAVLFALVMAPPSIFLAQQRTPVEMSLRSIEPKAGAAMILTEPVARGGKPGGASAPISAAFSSLAVAVEPPEAKVRPPAEVLIVLPVRAEDCPQLEAGLEGSCGRPDSPRHLGEPLTLESLNPRQSLIAEVDPDGVRSLELSESTPRSQLDVPVEWAMAAGEGTIELEVRCPRGTRVLIAQLPARETARCGAREARFHIALAPPPGSGLSLFLNELSEFHAHLDAERVEARIEAGHLEVAGGSRDLPLGPVPIDLRASSGHSVDLDVRQSAESGQNQVSLESDRADRVEVSGQDERLSWPDRHVNLVYLMLGLVAAALIPAGLEFALRRISK